MRISDWSSDVCASDLRFHTGAPRAASAAAADFALLDAAAGLPALDVFSLGSDAAPDRGATLLVQMATLAGATAMTWRGPGIKDAATMPSCGLPAEARRERAVLAVELPTGRGASSCVGSRDRQSVG